MLEDVEEDSREKHGPLDKKSEFGSSNRSHIDELKVTNIATSRFGGEDAEAKESEKFSDKRRESEDSRMKKMNIQVQDPDSSE
jgi:hypothetical protein